MGKKAAIELSMTTIIVIVLSIVLLILGFVFVRSIMCKAIGFTDQIGAKVDGEIKRLFESSSDDIVCIGSDTRVAMTPGEENIIRCAFNVKSQGNYRVTLDDISSSDIDPRENIRSWVVQDNWDSELSPNDQAAQKVIRILLPEDAPEGNLNVRIKATKDSKSITGLKDLDFRITKQGVVRNVLC